jgi:hypothetical protein
VDKYDQQYSAIFIGDLKYGVAVINIFLDLCWIVYKPIRNAPLISKVLSLINNSQLEFNAGQPIDLSK